jgi:hypothetical protein
MAPSRHPVVTQEFSMHIWIAAAVLFGAFVTTPQQATQNPRADKPSADAKPSPRPTPNDELIKLALAGMSEDILLGVVARADKTKYDTSADALLKLKSAGVTQRVMAAVLGLPSAPAPPAVPSATPTVNLPTPAPPLRRPAASSIPGSTLTVSEDPNLPTTAEPSAETNLRFTVFISAPQRDGFFDTTKEIQDSIKDIRDKLSKERNVILTISDDRKKADVILTVVQRGIGNVAYGRRVEFQDYYGGASLEQSPMIATTYWVSTMMQVGAYKKEFTGTQTQDNQGVSLSFGAWNKCASLIVSNIASWTRTNAVLINHYKTAATVER